MTIIWTSNMSFNIVIQYNMYIYVFTYCRYTNINAKLNINSLKHSLFFWTMNSVVTVSEQWNYEDMI